MQIRQLNKNEYSWPPAGFASLNLRAEGGDGRDSPGSGELVESAQSPEF
jgi:hypothetical protein